jgi:mannose-6-phosphate isomerase
MLCPSGEGEKAVQLIYVLEENKAVIRSAGDKVGTKLNAEDIYAVKPGEKITVEGSARIMRIIAK